MSRYTNIVERKMTSDVGSRPASENRYTRAAEASIVRNTPKTVEKEDMYSKYKGLNYDQVNTYLNDNNTPDSDKEFLKHYGVNVGYNSAEDYQKNISDIASQMQKNSAQTQNKKSGMQMFLENWIKADTGLRTGGYSSTDFGESPEFVALRKERDQLIQNKNKWEIDHAYDNYSNLEQSDDYRIYSRAVDPQNTVSRYFAGMPNEDIQSETTGTLAYAEDNEKSTYQYILFSQGVDAANDYLKQMTPLWDKRKQEAANQKVIDSMVTDTTVPGSTTSGKYVDANGGQTLLNNAASIPMGMVGGVIGGVASVFENATGNANPYSPWHSLSNYADTVRNTTAKYLEDNTTTKVAGYNVASSLYNAAYSAAQSLVGANTFGKAYTYLMGLSAFESEAKDLYEQGASSENILAGALLSGVAESLFEEFSIENLLTNSNPSGFKRIVKNVFKQAGAEASEEMATELSNSITDYLIRGGASDYEQRKRELMANGYSESEATKIAMKEIAKNIGYAGVEGALSGAGMSFGQQTIGFVKNKSTGKDARKYADREKVMDAAKAAGVDSEEVAMAERGDKLSDAELGAIINETRGKVAEGMKTYTSKDATEEDIRKQDDAISKYADIYGKEYQYAKKYNLSNDEKIKLDGVEEHDGTIYVRTQNGDRIRADEAPLTFRQAEIVSEAEGMSNEAVKQAFVSIANTNDTDVDTLSAAVGTIFFGARTQTMSWDEVQKQMVTDNAYMTEAQARAVYDAGYNLKAESISSRQAKVEQIFREFKGSAKPGTFKDNTDHDTLTDYQKMMVTLGEGLSKLGINVEMVQHGYGYNGKYVKSENTITIDVLATAGTKELMKNTVLPVMSHEVTHWMKDKSPQMYHEMSEFVLDYLTQSTGATREQIIDNQIAHYRATHKGKDISLDDAIDEIVARSCEDMLGNSKKLTEFLEKKDKSFIEKFRAAVKRAFDRVIALFKDVDGAMSYSPEAREFQKSVEYFEKLQAKWDAMFEDALKKNATGVNKTSVDNYGKDSDAEIRDKMAEVHDMEIQNAERYGLVPDANGNLVFSDDAFYSSDHVKDLRAKFSSESGMTFAELLEEYKGAIQIWNELGGELNSKFLDEWNNQNPTKKAFTIFKSQVGYKYNVELSTMCKKGIPLFEAIDTIVRKEALSQLATKTLGLDEKKVLYDVLKHHGFEIPCAICYVEQSRQREGRIIERFLNGFESKDKFKLGWNSTLEAIVSEMKKQGVDYTLESLDRSACTDNYEFKPINMDKATQDAFYDALIKLCNDEIDRWNKDERKPTQAKKSHLKKATLAAFKEAVGSRPNENLRIFRTLIADPDAIFRIDEDLLYSSFTNLNLSKCHTELGKLFGSQSGVSGSKSKERAVAYTGDILKKNWSASKTREAGGVRNQSNSDGMMYTMLDQIQFFVDMSAKGYYLHAYTKVIAELKLLGLSNGKINASLIPAVHKFLNADGTVNEELTREYAGLGADKKTAIFDDVEGISSKEAFMIIGMPEYSKSVCGICIGYSDNHIAALLDDARIQMIIGFHDKTDNPDKRFEKARYAHNYNGENEAVNRKTGETVHVAFGTFLAEAEKKFKRSKKGDYSGSYTHTDGNTYSVDDIPVLATVLYKEFCDSKGYDYAYKKFADHPNYYKLLADFGLRDSEGHYAPHKKVTFNFPETVPYLDADGTVQYEDTKEYMKRELEKELKVRDEISYQLADTSKDGILAELKMGVNEFGCDLQKMAQYWADKEGSSTEESDTMNADRDSMGNGYDGYSMSNNARTAYENGEKPLSKWSKNDIISAVSEIDSGKARLLEKVNLKTLKDHLLTKSSWHHTSMMYNKTDFYSIDEDAISGLDEKTIKDWATTKETRSLGREFRGDIKYLEWGGTKSHPKATEVKLTDVNIEERGSFYIVTDDDGKELIRKKIGSNGTEVTDYELAERMEASKREEEERIMANSSPDAYALYQSFVKSGYSSSGSGKLYPWGRKPNSYQYEMGLENFFKKGEQILVPNSNGGYTINTWNGKGWDAEANDTLYSERDIVTPEEMIEDAYNEGEIYGTELDEYMKYAKVRDIKIADRNRLGETIKNLNARKTEASAELDSLSEIATPSAEQRERITSIKAELKQILKDIKSAKDERREIESQIEKIKTVMTSLRADKKIQDAEEKARKSKEAERKAKMETLQERYDRHGVAMARERDKRIRTIRTSVKTLADWINVNGKENYVPEVLKTDVARFLMAFNYSTREALGETFEYIDDIGLVTMPGIGREEDITLTNSLSRLTETIKSIKKANDLSGNKEDIEEAYKGIILDLPRGYIETLEALVNLMQTRADSFGNRKVVEHMTLDELAVLSETLNTLKKSIKGINELHQNAAFKKASDLGKSEITFAKSLGRLKSRNNTVQKIFNMLGWENLLPHFFFKRLGKAGESLGKEFVDAQSKFARMSREILDFTDSLFTGEEAKRWRSETETFTDMSGEKFTMTIAQMMALYCHGQRETSKRHMFNGGIRIADITLNGKTITDTNSGHNITTAIYDEIVDKLSKYDDGKALRVAQAMQKFMSTVCASWGNEVSMIRFGKKDFTEEFYIPAEVDVSNVMNAEPSEGDSLFRLLNMSFAKPLNDKARNRIIIRDLFEVFATHTSDMAKYSAFALPTLDAYKFINYKETEKLGRAGAYSPDRVTSVRGAIEDAYGKAPTEYFFGLMRDINGSERSPRNTGLIRQMLRNYKIARVGGSLKVAALQVTAYPRAAMVLSPDSLARAFKYGSNFDEAIKYSGLSAWKDLGYFDINVARSLTDMITKAQTNTDKVREIGMKGAEKSDSVTWGVIWNACKIEALKRDERLAANSEAHLQKAGELMDEVIVSSQVMDSTLTRSALMRTKDSGMQELTAFMSEPTMTYNMVMDKVFDVITEYRQTGDLKESIRKNSGGLIKVATIHFIVSSFAAILEGAALFWRDHGDKDKDGKLIDEYFEKVFDSFKGNILLQVPILKEIISNIMGYSSKRMATQGFADTIDGLKRTFKWVSDMAENGKSKTNIVKAAYKLLTGVSEVGGVAISNATREVLDILNVVLEALGQDRINY